MADNDARITWKQVEQRYGPQTFRGQRGNVALFTIHWASKSKDYEGPRWQLDTMLPGFPDGTKRLSDTVEQAKGRAEQMLNTWLAGIGAEIK